MPKPKAPRWLTSAFAEGVIELAPHRPAPAYKGALGRCWLAQLDERRRPCSGRLERAHLIPRQRVENALGALLPPALPGADACPRCGGSGSINRADVEHPAQLRPYPCDCCGGSGFFFLTDEDRRDFILLAAWDPRNAVIGCEGHHRRLDCHATPALIIPQPALPAHAFEFANDWGLDTALNDRFPL